MIQELQKEVAAKNSFEANKSELKPARTLRSSNSSRHGLSTETSINGFQRKRQLEKVLPDEDIRFHEIIYNKLL